MSDLVRKIIVFEIRWRFVSWRALKLALALKQVSHKLPQVPWHIVIVAAQGINQGRQLGVFAPLYP